MVPKIDDRYIWLGFGIFLFVAVRGIRHAISNTVHLTETLPRGADLRKKKHSELEDAINLESLKILTTSPNLKISNSAISLIIGRFAQLPNAHEILNMDRISADEEVRQKARMAINFLKDWPLPSSSPGQHIPVDFSSEPSRPATPNLATRSMEEWTEYFRSVPPSQDVDPQVVMALIGQMRPQRNSEGREDGLVPSAEHPIAGWTSIPRARPLRDGELEEAEAERRTRRREAMVLHEGEGGIGEDDIIQPR